MSPPKFVLQFHDSDTREVILARDPMTMEFLTPSGSTTVSGPSTRHALMRAVDTLMGAKNPAVGFSLTPHGQPGPTQWRAVFSAATAFLDAPDDADKSAQLRAVLSDIGDVLPVAPSTPAPGEGAPSVEFLDAVDELTGAVIREALWRAAIDYCKALAARFDPKAAETHRAPWERARALALRLADLSAAARPPKAPGAAKPKRA